MNEYSDVEYTSNSDIIGCYDVLTDTIILNSKLIDYPELHDFILRHELLHYHAKDNVWMHAYIDLTDNWRGWFSKRVKYSLWIQKNISPFSLKYVFLRYLNVFLFFIFGIAEIFRLPFVLFYILKEKKGR